jgi:hypothetical protein
MVQVLWAAAIAFVIVTYITTLLPYTHEPNGKFNVDAGWRLALFVLLYFVLAPATLVDVVVGACVWRSYRARGKHLSVGWPILTCMAGLVLLFLIANII